MPESEPVDGTSKLLWEGLELGVDSTAFKESLAAMAGLQEGSGAKAIVCVDQSTIEVISPKKGTISERKATEGQISNCSLMQAGRGKSWSLISAKGEFLEDELASVTLRFPVDYHGAIAKEVASRFGPGVEKTLEENTLLGEYTAKVTMWNVGGTLWVLDKRDRIARLIHQAPASLSALEDLPAAPKRGEPVNLDDIGLGGGLDLNADDLDDIPVIDTDDRPDAGADAGS